MASGRPPARQRRDRTGFSSVRRLLDVSLRGGKDIAQVKAPVTARELERLSDLIEAGQLHPRIDRRYRFDDTPRPLPIWNRAGPGPRWSWRWHDVGLLPRWR